MASQRSQLRQQRIVKVKNIINYIDSLPGPPRDDSNQRPFLDQNDSLVTETGDSSSSESNSISTNNSDFNFLSTPRAEYIETLYEAFFAHVGLTLGAAEKVISLFNCLNRKLSVNPFKLPSLRYYWDKKAKATSVRAYILCHRSHSHGPFTGDPKNYGFYLCENDNIQAKVVPGEFFIHIPLRDQLQSILSTLPDSCWLSIHRNDVSNSHQARRVKTNVINGVEKLTLTIHSDEVASGGSSNEKILPVFISINEMKPEFRKKFFLLVALFVGPKKPPVECFLGPVVEELQDLSINPIQLNNQRKATLHLIGLVADAPMRAYLRNVKQYNHLNGCDWCLLKASTLGGARLYPNKTEEELIPLKRRPDDFQMLKRLIQEDPDNYRFQIVTNERFLGLSGISPLLLLADFNIVDGVAVEPMHSISLGVFRNLLMKGIFGNSSSSFFDPPFTRNDQVKIQLSERLESIHVTSEFTRAPRGIDQIHYWKSNEFDSFLGYFFYSTTRGLFKNVIINHFMCLSRLYYLSHTGGHDMTVTTEIKNLVNEFQMGCASLYGSTFLTYNLHVLSHLADSLEQLGPNSNISSYPLEDYMGILKKKVHRYSNIGPSLIRFFMSDFRYREYKIKRLDRWSLTREEKIAFGCSTEAEISSTTIDKNITTGNKTFLAAVLNDFFGREADVNPDDIMVFKTIKFHGKRYSASSYCLHKSRNDSNVKDKNKALFRIKYIVGFGSNFYLICNKYTTKSINIKFKGFTGYFSFPLDNIHEVHNLSTNLICLPLKEINSKVVFVACTTFFWKYKYDLLVEQFIWNK